MRYTFTALSMTSDYKYYNHNPEDNHISDCVTRAIGGATGLSYKTVGRLLAQTAQRLDCDKLCVCCYKHLLTHELGFTAYKCKHDITVREVTKEFNDEILIIRIDGHLTCAKYGVILDTWDCSDRLVDCFWVVT